MQTSSTRAQLLASSMITGVAVLAMSSGAFAQQSTGGAAGGVTGQTEGVSPTAKNDASGGASGSTVQELVVTGSRIPQPNLTSVSPLTTVTSAEVKLTGTTNVESLLNALPSAFAGQTQQASNGSDGTATINLRNLGDRRTLVLVDGRRLMPGDPGSSGAGEVPDINNIPSALVDRIDVVTGGASAVYGSDAVAGVVNFIMKKNFEGVQVDYQYSFDNHQQGNSDAKQYLTRFGLAVPKDVGGDGGIHNVSIVLGANSPDDKGNITAYATYQHVQAVLQSERDFSDCGIATGKGPGKVNNLHSCVGSSNSAYGRFDHTALGNVVDNPNGTKTFVPYTSAFAYNFNPLNFLQREDDRYTAGFFAHYDVNKMVQVYSDFMFMDDQTNAQIAPSGLFRGSGPNLSNGYTINCNNPLLGPTQAAALCPGSVITPGATGGDLKTLQSIGYRFAAVPRNSDFTHTDYKVDVGLRGDLGSGWTYDAYMQLGISRIDEHITGYASVNKVQNALNVINVAGVPTCSNLDPSCVPLDIFAAQSKNITAAAYNYVLASSFTTGETREQIASASVTGDLGHYGVKSPFAADGVGVSFGAEYRRDSITQNYDSEQQAGDLSGGNGQLLDAAGSTNVKELFGELQVPLAHDVPFIEDLTLNAGYRFSHYNFAGDTNTYKFGAEYRPIQDVLIRASYNRAVRAPNVQELFAPNVTGLAGYIDLCGVPEGGGVPASSKAACANTGLTAAEYGVTTVCPAGQCDIRTGGGAVTGLKPEVADTYSVGAVVQPHFLPGFSASIDYFNIKVKNIIQAGVASPTTILQGCLASATSPYCALIHRNPIDGDLFSNDGYIFQTNGNAGFLATDGIDIAANYRYTLPDWFHGSSAGSVDLSFVGTWVDHLTSEPTPGLGTYDCAGLYGTTCLTPTPKFRSETRITWNTPIKLTASVRWRYMSGVGLDLLSPNPLLNGVANDTSEGHLPSFSYFDLTFTYKLRDGLALRAGVNNIFDKDPPVIDANGFSISNPGNFGNGNTFPGVYDALGRNIFMGFTANF